MAVNCALGQQGRHSTLPKASSERSRLPVSAAHSVTLPVLLLVATRAPSGENRTA